MLTIIISLAIWLFAVVIAITVHEFAHALMADRLGDPTPRLHQRLSLNPLNHYDQIGTTMLLVTATLRAFGVPIIPFGWAKPVMFDPYNLRHPKRDSLLIALAGPISNIVTAVLISLVLRYFVMEIPVVSLIASSIVIINIALAIFNLIPVYPLDGSKILLGLLPNDLAYEYQAIFQRYGTLILIFMIFPFGGTSAISALIAPVINFFLNLLLP